MSPPGGNKENRGLVRGCSSGAGEGHMRIKIWSLCTGMPGPCGGDSLLRPEAE